MFTFENPVQGNFGWRGGTIFIPEIFVLVISLGVYTATFIAEAVRSGILAVDKGQREAAAALGLKPGFILARIIMPQAMRVIIPPSINQYLNLTKNSSLAMAIGFPDLVAVFAGTTLNQVGQAIEIMLMTMFTYLALSTIVSLFLNWYNSRVKLVER
uniref:General L-amino acid transport system permease protein aapQ n=1 Tax=Magallana gigas TaxID=29159 RepID=K1PVM4_MAGGI